MDSIEIKSQRNYIEKRENNLFSAQQKIVKEREDIIHSITS